MRYEMSIYWVEADGPFLAKVTEPPGCMADGPTCEAALANGKVESSEWIKTARSLDRPIPKTWRKLAYEFIKFDLQITWSKTWAWQRIRLQTNRSEGASFPNTSGVL